MPDLASAASRAATLAWSWSRQAPVGGLGDPVGGQVPSSEGIVDGVGQVVEARHGVDVAHRWVPTGFLGGAISEHPSSYCIGGKASGEFRGWYHPGQGEPHGQR